MPLGLSLPEPLIEVSTPNRTRLVVEPLESGFGTTIGHSLTRILLSALEGAALASVRIAEITPGAERIEHVRESVPELLANLTAVHLSRDPGSAGRGILTLRATGAVRAYAGDIRDAGGYRVTNPDQHLATLTHPAASLTMSLEAVNGRGYAPGAESSNGPDAIALAARFTPVERAHYKVTRTRVGQHTNYDRLLLDVWTDGSVDGEQAVAAAAAILSAQLLPLRSLSAGAIQSEPAPALVPPTPVEDTPITALALSMRSHNALSRAGLATIEQLLTHPREHLLALRGVGERAYLEVRGALLALDYPDLDDPPPRRRHSR